MEEMKKYDEAITTAEDRRLLADAIIRGDYDVVETERNLVDAKHEVEE